MPDATRRLPRCCIVCCFARRSVVYFDQTSRRSCRGRFVRAGANLRRRRRRRRRRLTGDGDRDRLARCHYCPSVRTSVRARKPQGRRRMRRRRRRRKRKEWATNAMGVGGQHEDDLRDLIKIAAGWLGQDEMRCSGDHLDQAWRVGLWSRTRGCYCRFYKTIFACKL